MLEGDAALMPLDRDATWCGVPPTALWRAAGKPGDPRGARVRVTKRIPSQAGLGGGSSDAAAALLGLGRFWRLPATLDFLAPVAATLGADVPFFLIGGAALGLGRGELLYPLVNLPRRRRRGAAGLRRLHARRLPLAGGGAGCRSLER